MDDLSADLVQLIGTYLDASSALALSRVNVATNQLCLPPDCPFWRHALLHLLPPRVSETAALLADLHPSNLRGFVASLAKPGNFSKIRLLKGKVAKFRKPLAARPTGLARLLGTRAAEAALLRAEPQEAARVLRQTFPTLPPHAQRRLRAASPLRHLFELVSLEFCFFSRW